MFQIDCKKKILPCFGAAIATLCIICLSLPSAEIVFLPIDTEGTASIYLSDSFENKKVGYIVDGGKRGALERAFFKARNKSTFKTIQDEKVSTLVFVCSHPHSDHMDGLVSLLKDQSISWKDVESINFVDYNASEDKRLSSIFKSVQPTAKSAYFNAQGKDVLAQFQTKDLVVNNFVYQADQKASAHGKTVITESLLLGENGSACQVVDFDDADSRLIELWAASSTNVSKPSKRVFVIPHHGSRYTDNRPLQNDSIKPTDVVFTVNVENKYSHPDPKIWLDWIKVVGKERVFFTCEGNGVRVTPNGITTAPPSKELVSAILDFKIKKLLLKIRTLEEKWSQIYDKQALIMAFSTERVEVLLGETAGKRISAPATLTKNEVTLLKRELEIKMQKDLSELKSVSEHLSALEDIYLNGSSLTSIVNQYFSRHFNGDRIRADPSSINAYTELNTKFEKNGLKTPIYSSNRAEIRQHRFSASTTNFPYFGGIVFGNKVSSKLGTPIHSTVTFDDELVEIAISLNMISGATEVFYFSDCTEQELMAAYKIVHVNAEMRTKPECNLVGMSNNLGSRWEFGVHPALLGTNVSYDLMALDMLISKYKERYISREFCSYQWFERETRIVARNGGQLKVEGDLAFRLWVPPANMKELLLEAMSEYRSRTSNRINNLRPRITREEATYAELKQLELIIEKVRSVSLMQDEVEKIRNDFKVFFINIDRFRLTLAIMNWLADHDALPVLSPTFRIGLSRTNMYSSDAELIANSSNILVGKRIVLDSFLEHWLTQPDDPAPKVDPAPKFKDKKQPQPESLWLGILAVVLLFGMLLFGIIFRSK